MSDGETPMAPARGGRPWLKLALIASLAVNLLFIGAAAARWYVGYGPERYARLTQTQLIPRNFFHDLGPARRMELMAILRSKDKDIRDGRRVVKAEVIQLADALVAEPYDPARVQAAVEGFTASNEALFRTGSGAALAMIGQLTTEERKLMADHLRNREGQGRGKPAKPGDDKPDDP